MRHKSRWGWISLAVGGLVAGALGVVFVVLDLEQADQLASVVGVFVALAGLGTSAFGVVLARRGQASSPHPSPSGAVAPSRADAVTAAGQRPVTAGDDAGAIQTGDAGHATVAGAGDTSNRITGGTFHAPVTMARDITHPPSSPVSPPAQGPEGRDAPDGSGQPR